MTKRTERYTICESYCELKLRFRYCSERLQNQIIVCGLKAILDANR